MDRHNAIPFRNNTIVKTPYIVIHDLACSSILLISSANHLTYLVSELPQICKEHVDIRYLTVTVG